MNLVKFQVIKYINSNLLRFYILIMQDQKGKLRKKSNLKLHQKNNIHRNKSNQRGEGLIL